MALFRKRHDPESARVLGLFRPVGDAVDAAQRALLSAVPTSRDPGAPLTAALDEFSRHLDEIGALMGSWRTPRSEHVWQRCSKALAEARVAAERLRADPPAPTAFEQLNFRLGDILAPLEEFAEAERRLRGKPV